VFLPGGVDYLDRLKGVTPKLLAWEALLRDYPHYRTGHVFLQVVIGARNKIQIQQVRLLLRKGIVMLIILIGVVIGIRIYCDKSGGPRFPPGGHRRNAI